MQNVNIFFNLDSFRRYLDAGTVNGIFQKAKKQSETGKIDFCGTETWTEANDLMRDGDSKSAALMKSAGGIKASAGEGTKTRRYSAVCGGAANVPAMLMGLPKSMIAQKKIVYKNSKVLNICYNLTVDFSVKREDIIRASAALAGAVMGLEKRGYRVNLYVCCASEEGRDICAFFVKIKDSGQYIDPKKLAYPLVNPSMLRRHFFRYVEIAPGLSDSRWPLGYGHLLRSKNDLQKLASGSGLNLKDIICLDDIKNMNPEKIAEFLAN